MVLHNTQDILTVHRRGLALAALVLVAAALLMPTLRTTQGLL